MGKYKSLGVSFDRAFRLDLNNNFIDIDTDIQSQNERVNDLIKGTPQPSEVVDARGGYPVLRERMNNVDKQFAETGTQLNNKKFVSKTIEKMLYGQTTKIVCYGDSITFGYVPSVGGQVANPYPKVLQEKLRKVYNNNLITVINSGMSGRQTDDALVSIQTQVFDHSPDLMIFMMGINDVRGHPTYGPTIPPDNYRANLISIAKTAKDKGIEVVLMTSNPILDTNNNYHKKLVAYAKIVKEVAETYGCAYLDLQSELTKMFFNRVEAPVSFLPDNIHLADDKYKIIAELLIGEILYNNNASNILKINKNTLNIPIAYSPYVETDITAFFVNDGQFFKSNYRMSMDGSAGSYLRFNFYVDVPGISLILRSPKNGTGGVISVLDNGTTVKSVSFYQNETHVFEAENIIIEDLSVGFHTIEFLSSNMTQGETTNTNPNAYFTEFVFKPKISKEVKKYVLDASKTVGTLEQYSKVNDGVLRFTNPNTTNGGTGAILFDKQAELTQGKTLVIEVEGKFHDGSGFTWFGNKASSQSPSNVNTGYMVFLQNTGTFLFNFGTDNIYGTSTANNTSAIPNFSEVNKIRVEHTASGLITVFLNGTQVLQATQTKAHTGFFGLYSFKPGTVEISRFEFCYK